MSIYLVFEINGHEENTGEKCSKTSINELYDFVEEPDISCGRLKWTGNTMGMDGKEIPNRNLIVRFNGGMEEVIHEMRQANNVKINLRKKTVDIWKN
jgi:hypothetical protein